MDEAGDPLLDQGNGRAGDVGAVARRRALIGRTDELLAGLEGQNELVGEVLSLSLGTENPGCAEGQETVAEGIGERGLRIELVAAVDGEGKRRVGLGIGTGEAVEDVVGRDVDEPGGRGQGDPERLLEVGPARSRGIALALINPGEPGRIEDNLGLLIADPIDSSGIGRIESGETRKSHRRISSRHLMPAGGEVVEEPASDLSRSADDEGAHWGVHYESFGMGL